MHSSHISDWLASSFAVTISSDDLSRFCEKFNELLGEDPNALYHGTRVDKFVKNHYYSLLGYILAYQIYLPYKILGYLFEHGGNLRFCGNDSSLEYFSDVEVNVCTMAFIAYHGIASLREFYVLTPAEGSAAESDQHLYRNRAQHDCVQELIEIHENPEGCDSPEAIFQYYRQLVTEIKSLERQIDNAGQFTDKCTLHRRVAWLFENLAKAEFFDDGAYGWAIAQALRHEQQALACTRWLFDAERRDSISNKIAELDGVLENTQKVFLPRRAQRRWQSQGPQEALSLSFHERRMNEIITNGEPDEILHPVENPSKGRPFIKPVQFHDEDDHTASTAPRSSDEADSGEDAEYKEAEGRGPSIAVTSRA